MKLLIIGSDRKLFEDKSSVLERTIEYSKHVEELHVIVFSLASQNFSKKNIGNLYIHPTNSFSRYFYVLDAFILGKKIIKEYSFVRGASVISSQDPFECGLVGLLLKKYFNLPLHLQIHTDFFSQHFLNGFLNKIRSLIYHFTIPAASGIRVVSLEIAQNLKNKFLKLSAKINILPVWTDMSLVASASKSVEFEKRMARFKFTILMVSRLSREKRIETALYALKNLVSKEPFIGLAIVGDGPEKISLQKLAEKLGVSENVVFFGWQESPASFYKSAKVFLFTSEFEGYGMSLVEAAAAGCPIVTTDVGIARQICHNEEDSFICPVGDVSCIAESIYKLVENDGLRRIFSQKMSVEVSKMFLSLPEYAEKYVGALKDLVPLDKIKND